MAKVAETVRASVVEIYTNANRGSVTGWIYRVDGNGRAWILTNAQVVGGSETVTLRLPWNNSIHTGLVSGEDADRDLAVLTICCSLNWRALPSAPSYATRAGSEIVTLGFPGYRTGMEMSVTTGVVSSIAFHDASRSWLIQTQADVSLYPGYSGGPLLNAQGEVIGVIIRTVNDNIGLAISMRTVEAELDNIEVTPTATATPTPWPFTFSATSFPPIRPTAVWGSWGSWPGAATPFPSTGITGLLTHDPRDDRIGCSTNWNDETVISNDSVDAAAFLRFETPNVRQWSIGFLYHDVEGDSHSATIVWADGPNNVFARHWVRREGKLVQDPPSERIGANVLRIGRGYANELSFRTSSSGSFLRLNDEAVIEVPASQLIRRNGRSSVCVGFHSEEDDRYSIRYWDLRTRFASEGVSGSVSHSDPDSGEIACPVSISDDAYFSSDARDSWAVFDFVTPHVEKWSLAFVHHDNARKHSRTTVARDDYSYYSVSHLSYNNGKWNEIHSENIQGSMFKWGSREKNRLEFETTRYGTSLFLNGEKVVDAPVSPAIRQQGGVRLCAGINEDEAAPYTINYSDLWVWAE